MAFRNSFRALIAVGFMGLPVVSQANVNLITNGSFETGNLNGWTAAGSGTTPGSGIVVIDSATQYGDVIPLDPFTFSPDAGGVHQAYFVDDNAMETLTQTVNLQAGNVYDVGFDLFATVSGAANPNSYSLTGSLGSQTIGLANSGAKSPLRTIRTKFSFRS